MRQQHLPHSDHHFLPDLSGAGHAVEDFFGRVQRGLNWDNLKHVPAHVGHGIRHEWRVLPRWAQWLLSIVVIVFVGLILFLANPNWDWARGFVSSIVSGKLHRKVSIEGHLRVHLFSFTPKATVGGLRIVEPTSGVAGAPKEDLANVGNISANTELMPLFTGKIVLPRLQIDKPVVVAFQDAKGHANWDFSNGQKAGQPLKLPLIKNFIINDGHITFTSLQRKMRFTGTVFAHEKAGSGQQAFGLNGDGTLNGRAFTMRATGGPLLNIRSSVPYPFDMTVKAGDTVITARGRVTHPFDLGHIGGAASVTGNDLADLYYLTGLTFPNTPAYRVTANVTRDNMVYHIGGIRGRVGASDLEGALKVDVSNHGRPYLTGDLRSRVLNFKDLGSLFGATAANAPTGVKVGVAPQATTGRRLLPDASLDVERVRGMDAKVSYHAASVNAPNLPLRAVSLGVDLDHGLLRLDPIDFTFPQGHLTGTASINARTANQTNAVDMRLTNVAVQEFLPAVQGAKPIEGTLSARLKATGGGNSVHKAAASADGDFVAVMPGGTMRQSLAELMGVDATKGLFMYLSKDPHQTDVRCAVADFNIHNGVATAQTIVLDTGVVLVNGNGSVNLNDESMKLTFQGKPKKFRLIRVDAPIVIGGHLSQPTFGVNPGPAIVQGGLAAIFHTILPFVGFDMAKDANCSGLIGEAHAEGAPPVR